MKALLRMIPMLVFLILAAVAAGHGTEGHWRRSCEQMWSRHKWHELVAVGDNLWRLQKADAEVLCFAMLASQQSGNAANTQLFAERMLSKHALNWKMESEAIKLLQPRDTRQLVALHRSHITILLLCASLMINLLHIRRRHVSPWEILPAIAGCIVLLI